MNKNRINKTEEDNEKIHFNKMARDYDSNYKYFDEFTQYKICKKITELTKLVDPTKDKIKLLDLGCGTGEYTKQIAEIFPNANITGLDISEKIIRIAEKKCRKYKNVRFVVRSAYNTGFRDDYFDVVTGFYFLHHINIRKIAQEINRILKKKGKVFFYEPNIINPIVYLIKSSSFLKKIAGDSPDEWAINPLKIRRQLSPLSLSKMYSSEYIPPIPCISTKCKITLDKFSMPLSRFILTKYLGGSLLLFAVKR